MFVHMPCMAIMQMAIMQIINMASVFDRGVAAINSVGMACVIAMENFVGEGCTGTQCPRANGECNALHSPYPFDSRRSASIMCQLVLSPHLS